MSSVQAATARRSDFASETAITARSAGMYDGHLTNEWIALDAPQGGVVAAIAVRAMQAELGLPDHTLRSVTTVFADRVDPGPIEIEVRVLRQGGSTAQALATVRSRGSAGGHTSIALFGKPRHAFAFTDVEPPDVRPPEECVSFRQLGPCEGFFAMIEARPAMGHAPWDQYVPTSSEQAYWWRYDDPVSSDGSFDQLALLPLCDTMIGAIQERVGPAHVGDYFSPSADLTVHILGEPRSDWILVHNRARHAGAGFSSLEVTLWDRSKNLVAYATQVAFIRMLSGADTA